MNLRITNLFISYFLIVAMVAVLIPGTPTWAAPPSGGDKVEKALLEKIAANPKAKYDVVINMQPGKSRDAWQIVQSAGGRYGRSLPIIDGASAILPGHAVLGIANNPNVVKIYEDSRMTLATVPVSSVGTLAVDAPSVWDLGYTGRGVGVAVLDSGVAPHPDLTSPTNRIIASVDLSGNTAGTADLGGHGTHVAGIIAGNGYASDGKYRGIAPEANIISVKVTNDTGAGSYSAVISGIQWVVRNKSVYNIRVMNISLGSPVTRSYKDDPLIAALEIAWFSGIVVVVSAGNSGPAAGTISSPGNDPYSITVGVLDDVGTAARSDDLMADFSSRGPTLIDGIQKPDLVAPGRRVVSLRSTGSYLDETLPERVTDAAYFRLSGTSMASPLVAGIAALMLQKDPSLKPNQIKYILTHTATPLSYDANTAGAGSVSASSAINFTGRDIANRGKRPNSNFARTIYRLAKGAPLVWRDPYYMGRNWADYTWETLPWNDFTWDNFSWESFDWGAASWSDYTWEDFTWEDFTWESTAWDNSTWDSTSWDSTILD